MNILVTGSAGFIGYHLIKGLASSSHQIIGIDNINSYYDINLKYARLADCGIQNIRPGELVQSHKFSNYRFIQEDIADKKHLDALFEKQRFDLVVNLAAQAGVRYSISNPYEYAHSNLTGFLNLLEACRNFSCKRLIYASSSSVYGETQQVPFRESQQVDHPVSFYAATKKSNELMAYTYSHLFHFQTIGLRFFTVYGPWGRPDMAPMLFADAMTKQKTIKVFNSGNLYRDFTYIDDIIKGIINMIQKPTNDTQAHIYNIGRGKPMKLLDFIDILEQKIGFTALKEFVGMQQGDVSITYADTTLLEKDYDYSPATDLEEGIQSFTDWYRSYYHIL